MTFLYHDLQYMHKNMLEAQHKGGGFDLTIRELADIFRVKSTSAVVYRLNLLVAAGFVITKGNGRYKTYRAVDDVDII